MARFLPRRKALSVYPGPDVALLAKALQDLGVLALLAPDAGGEELDAGPGGQAHDPVHHRVDALLFDDAAALGAVGGAAAGVEQAQVVVYLRHRAHGGPGVVAGALLVDGDGRGQALDGVHLGLFHLADELAGIGGEALHVPALALGVDGVEGQRAFAGAGQAREDDELVPGDGEVDILQIVFPGAPDDDVVHDSFWFIFYVCRFFFSVKRKNGGKRKAQRVNKDWRWPER